jgi:hypothetical protein
VYWSQARVPICNSHFSRMLKKLASPFCSFGLSCLFGLSRLFGQACVFG